MTFAPTASKVPGTAYIDSSALLKLSVREAETSALEADLAGRDGLVTSRLAALECHRAARRASRPRVLQAVDEVLSSVYLVDITEAILDQAAEAEPLLLRSLDAIHLATALSIGDPGLDLITYDDRLANAARAHGLSVVQPGRNPALSFQLSAPSSQLPAPAPSSQLPAPAPSSQLPAPSSQL